MGERRGGSWVVLVGLGKAICPKCQFCAKSSTLHLQRFEERKNRNCRQNKASGSHMPLHLAMVEVVLVFSAFDRLRGKRPYLGI